MRTGRGHGDRRQAYGQPRAQLVEMIDDAHARVVADLADRDCHAVGLLLQRRSRGGAASVAATRRRLARVDRHGRRLRWGAG